MKYKIGVRIISYQDEWRENVIVDGADLCSSLRKILLEDGDGIYEVAELQSDMPKVKENE